MIDLRKYVGIPFEDKASSLSGADCFGLIRLFYWVEYGREVPDPNIKPGYSSRIFAKYMLEIQRNWTTIIEPEPYCVVAMAHDTEIPGVVQHFGIYLPGGKLLHSLQQVGSHIVAIESCKWAIKAYHKWRY